MRIQAALVHEQGVDFAVMVVKPSALAPATRDRVVVDAGRYFPGSPVVLMAQRSDGLPEYYGRRDIVNFLSDVPFEALPWQWFDAN